MSTDKTRAIAKCEPWCLSHVDGVTHSVEWPCVSEDHATELSQHHRLDEHGVSREVLSVAVLRDHETETTTVTVQTPAARQLALRLDEARRVHAELGALLTPEQSD